MTDKGLEKEYENISHCLLVWIYTLSLKLLVMLVWKVVSV